MQARAAYIRSIGTTGILVAAALLMLATVGALVAYDGWPGGEGAEPVTSVPVQTPRNVSVVRRVAPPAASRLVGRVAAAETPATGLVRGVSAQGGSTVGLVKIPPSPPGVVAPDPQPEPTPAVAVEAPPVGEPAPPARPDLPLPEPVAAPVEGTEEFAYSLVGTTVPQPEDQPADGTLVGEPSVEQAPLGIDFSELVLPLQ